jgi:hypothetical protein
MDAHRDYWGRRDSPRSFPSNSNRQLPSTRKARDQPTATNEDLVKRSTGPQREYSDNATRAESETRFGRLRVAHNQCTIAHATHSRCCNHVQASVCRRTATCFALTGAQ